MLYLKKKRLFVFFTTTSILLEMTHTLIFIIQTGLSGQANLNLQKKKNFQFRDYIRKTELSWVELRTGVGFNSGVVC
jgi:hypothetical protein